MSICFLLRMSGRDKVLDGKPWSFDCSLLVLKNVENMDDFCFTKSWVQAHSLSLDIAGYRGLAN